MGTSFFKTTVEVEKIGGKYVLGISAAYVGDKPEIELAEALGKERALVGLGSKHFLTTLDSSWIGVDLDSVLKDGSLSATQLATLSRLSSGEIRSDYSKPYTVEIDGVPIALSFSLGQEENYRPEVLRVRGNQLFLEKEGDGEAYLSLGVRPFGKEKIVIPEEKSKIIQIRDKLSELASKNLST